MGIFTARWLLTHHLEKREDRTVQYLQRVRTQISDGVSIDETRQLDGPLEEGVGDPAVEQSEALSLASFTGQLPQHLHTAGVLHLGEKGWRGWNWVDKREKKSFERKSRN